MNECIITNEAYEALKSRAKNRQLDGKLIVGRGWLVLFSDKNLEHLYSIAQTGESLSDVIIRKCRLHEEREQMGLRD